MLISGIDENHKLLILRNWQKNYKAAKVDSRPFHLLGKGK